MVAEILGHARLETTRRYSPPADKDKEDVLKIDHGWPLTAYLPAETGVKIDSWPVLPISGFHLSSSAGTKPER
ncbi:hypothetical protein GCM10020001_104320 [Nonomuraea salmonea]